MPEKVKKLLKEIEECDTKCTSSFYIQFNETYDQQHNDKSRMKRAKFYLNRNGSSYLANKFKTFVNSF